MTKERLRRYITLKREITDLEARVREAEENITSLRSPSFDGVPSAHGSPGSPIEDAVVALVDLKEHYERKLAVMHAEQRAVEEAIASLEDSVERQLMRARYLDGQVWEEVCLTIGYAWSQTHRIHASALQHISNINEEKPPKA